MTKSIRRIVFWGTPDFAIPSLEALINNGYNVVAVITNPDEPVGRKQILTSPPIKVLAEKRKISIYQPEKLDIRNLKLEIPDADLYVVAAYGKIIPKEILEIPKYGALNIHPSLLPRWRGPSPIQYAILNGDTETGVTVIKIDEKMDHGPIIANSKSQIANSITYKELHDTLAKLGANLLTETLPKWINGEITPKPQDDSKATYSKILKKEDGRIDWSRPAQTIERMVRALNPWPGTWTMWPTDKKINRIKIEKADWTEEESFTGKPGYVWHTSRFPLLVKTEKGSLIVRQITLEGKKTLSTESFLKGYSTIYGSVLI